MLRWDVRLGPDIHIAVDASPMLRLHGGLRKIKYPPVTAEDTRRMLYEIMSEKQRQQLEE